ncbi:MAG: glycoside hydrolase family 28 protein [Ignavibacteriales bacterium]|nr:glycoside hydrolase family 28 protein [Ignavibacteriales bacterium]
MYRILILLVVICTTLFSQTPHTNYTWKTYKKLLKRVKVPVFPSQTFVVSDFGAKPDGATDCSTAINNAIKKCNASGGGKVIIPAGKYLTGPITLLSNVNLEIAEGAVVSFIADPAKYLPQVLTRFEGMELYNYSPLLYAYKQKNIAITGKGILEGSGSNENWWRWCGKPVYGWKAGNPNQKAARTRLVEMVDKNTPAKERIFGQGDYLRPNFIQPYLCKNILIEGVTLKNSPMWFINPVLCSNITVRNMTIEGLGPNNDGCDPESSNDILIENCFFNTGDDCIAIKSGRNNDGRRINVPSENIIIRNCTMKEGHGGVVMGSEISGGVRNVFAEDCTMDSPNLERAIRFKTNSVRGGAIENIHVRNITVGQVSDAVLKVDFYYEEGDAGKFPPSMKNVSLQNVTSKKSPYAIWIKAYPHSPVTGLKLTNCTFDGVSKISVLENVIKPCFNTVTINGKTLINE